MDSKRFVACIYVKDTKAVRGFSDDTVIAEDAATLAASYGENDIDGIIVFDLSEGTQTPHTTARELICKICAHVPVPVYAGGCIRGAEDADLLIGAGCEKLIMRPAKEEDRKLLPELSERFGKERIAAAIAELDDLRGVTLGLLEETISELLLLDERAIKAYLGTTALPCTVFLPEVSLDKMLAALEKSNVSGLSGDIVNQNRKEITPLKSICRERHIPVRLFEPPMPFSEFKLLSDGLIPVVVQEYDTGQVLMVAYMNEEAYLTTLRTKKMTYYSRSRKELWVKGLTSGHFQYVKSLSIDCDNDTLLAKVRQIGAACHTGSHSCFYRDLLPMPEADKAHIGLSGAALSRQQKIAMRTEDFVRQIGAILEEE